MWSDRGNDLRPHLCTPNFLSLNNLTCEIFRNRIDDLVLPRQYNTVIVGLGGSASRDYLPNCGVVVDLVRVGSHSQWISLERIPRAPLYSPVKRRMERFPVTRCIFSNHTFSTTLSHLANKPIGEEWPRSLLLVYADYVTFKQDSIVLLNDLSCMNCRTSRSTTDYFRGLRPTRPCRGGPAPVWRDRLCRPMIPAWCRVRSNQRIMRDLLDGASYWLWFPWICQLAVSQDIEWCVAFG